MIIKKLYILVTYVATLLALTACDDENNIGSSISKGEVRIEIDSLFTVSGHSVRNESFDSRSSTLLLGRLAAEGYGTLDCSYASQLMPASTLSIPDTIPVEDICGMHLKFTYSKDALTGDSLSPQQVSVYRLLRQIPPDINNLTDLSGYYDPSSPLGAKTFSASALGSATSSSKTGIISIPLSKEFAQEIVSEYRSNPSIFARPENFVAKFAGLFVRSTFGRGLVINMSNTEFTCYYNYIRQVTVVKDGVSTRVDSLFTDSTTLFSISPEVLSANLLRLTPDPSIEALITQGNCIIQSPGGYNVRVKFPADQIIERYYREDFNLSVVNTLSFEIPVRTVTNDYGLTRPPYLLMVKTKDLDKFFKENRLPQEEDTECFYAKYSSSSDSYTFNGMRPYILSLMRNGGEVTPEDMDFTLVPVNITVETVNSGSSQRSIVTACDYYINKPTLCRLDLEGAKVRFTYSRQYLK